MPHHLKNMRSHKDFWKQETEEREEREEGKVGEREEGRDTEEEKVRC